MSAVREDTLRHQLEEAAEEASRSLVLPLKRLFDAARDHADEAALLRREARRTRSEPRLAAVKPRIEPDEDEEPTIRCELPNGPRKP